MLFSCFFPLKCKKKQIHLFKKYYKHQKGEIIRLDTSKTIG